VSAVAFPTRPFDRWTNDVSAFLMDYVGRPLADAPGYMLRGLGDWYLQGWLARDVAERLADCRWPPRATLIRYYTDRRPKEVLAALSERFKAYEVM
jgi:hypothetical protein